MLFMRLSDVDGEKIRSLIATEWSIVYDSAVKRIYFYTFDSRDVRWVDFGAFDFSCAAPAKLLDLRLEGRGDVSGRFVKATAQENRKMVEANASVVPKRSDVPGDGLQRIYLYPESLPCIEEGVLP